MKDNHWEDQFKAQKVEEPRILSGHDFNNFVPDQKRQFQGKSYETTKFFITITQIFSQFSDNNFD